MAPKKRRRMGVSAHLNPLEGLGERWDACSTPAAANRIWGELERAGFDPFRELQLAGRKVTDVYGRAFGVKPPENC